MAAEMNVHYLGSVPLDPLIARSCDQGLNPIEQFPQSAFVMHFKKIVSSAYT